MSSHNDITEFEEHTCYVTNINSSRELLTRATYSLTLEECQSNIGITIPISSSIIVQDLDFRLEVHHNKYLIPSSHNIDTNGLGVFLSCNEPDLLEDNNVVVEFTFECSNYPYELQATSIHTNVIKHELTKKQPNWGFRNFMWTKPIFSIPDTLQFKVYIKIIDIIPVSTTD